MSALKSQRGGRIPFFGGKRRLPRARPQKTVYEPRPAGELDCDALADEVLLKYLSDFAAPWGMSRSGLGRRLSSGSTPACSKNTTEPHVLTNPDLLDSACARPRNHWSYGERDVAILATELLFGIARNHPFVQGNKRTAFTAMIGFLGCNGYRFMVDDDEACADHIIAVLEGRATQSSFSNILHEVIEPVRIWGVR